MLKNKNTFLLLLASLLPLATFAQTTAAAITTEPTNYMEILMISVAILLVVVVWVLANVLTMVSKQALALSKSAPKVMMIFVVAMGSMFATNTYAQTAAVADTASKKVSTDFYGGLSYNTFWTMTSVILLELLVVLLLVLFIRNIFRSIHPKEKLVVNGKVASDSWLLRTWHKLDKQFFT